MQAPLQARNDSDAVQTKTARTATQEQRLVDNRPTAVAQRKLAEMMNNSPRVLQQRALSDAIHNSPRMVAQRHEMNALFGGAVRPQGDGAMSAELSPAQREEKPNNTGLPKQLKSGMESLSGMSMDHVKVHYNSDKLAQLQAHAYALGSEIHLGAGQERHLPHEAWHIVQQAQGRVRPTLQMKAGAVNDDPSLEKEADMMGEKAAQFEGEHDARNLVAEERVAGVATQRVAGFNETASAHSHLQAAGARDIAQLQAGAGATMTDTSVASAQCYRQLANNSPQTMQLKQRAEMMTASTSTTSMRATQLQPPIESGNHALQRMVIYADDVLQIDTVISADLAFQHAMAQGLTLTLEALEAAAQDTYRIDADEPVVITGHGVPGRVQGRSASDIATALLKIKNIDKAAFIYIASCDAATDLEDTPKSSVVDITHEVMNKATKVVGAPGIAVTDYGGTTGDAQTHYLKPTEDLACAVENLITHVTRMHDIKASKGFPSLDRAEQWGQAQIQDKEFLNFYTIFIKTLSGMDISLVKKLLGDCDMALTANGPRAGWPDWLQGWIAQDEAGAQTCDDALWLKFRQKNDLSPAKQGLEGIRDNHILSMISRATHGKLPLIGKGVGEDNAEEMSYGRMMGDAQWYRQQRAVMERFGMVGPDESIKPKHDHSSDYIG